MTLDPPKFVNADRLYRRSEYMEVFNKRISYDDLLLLEKLQYHDFRASLSGLLRAVGKSRVWLLKRIDMYRKSRVYLSSDLNIAMIGLGKLIVITERRFLEKGSLPQIFWFQALTGLVDGRYVALHYYYPLKEGPTYILQPIYRKMKRLGIKHYSIFDATVSLGNKVKLTKYFDLRRRRLVFPWKDMYEDVVYGLGEDLGSLMSREKRSKPRDIVDLIIASELQVDPLVTLKEIAEKYRISVWKIRKHFREDVYYNVFRGLYAYLSLLPLRERTIAYVFLRFPEEKLVENFVSATYGKPFVNTYYMSLSDPKGLLLLVALPILEYPNMVLFLRGLLREGILEYFKIEPVEPYTQPPEYLRSPIYTIPYRNYDIPSGSWATSSKRLLELHANFAHALEKAGLLSRRPR